MANILNISDFSANVATNTDNQIKYLKACSYGEVIIYVAYTISFPRWSHTLVEITSYDKHPSIFNAFGNVNLWNFVGCVAQW